jgi:hypothetical protein
MAKTVLPADASIYSPGIQQVDFSNFNSVVGAVFDFTRLFAIIDVTAQRIIYTTSGHDSNLGGSYSDPILYLTYDTTGFPGGPLQVIYDLASAPTAIYDGTGTQPILSTTDSITGKEGLDINLLNSSFGGQLGWPLPSSTTSGYNDALSVGFINGGNLVTPNMDPMTNNLKVDIDNISTTTSIPVIIEGSAGTISTSLDYWNGNPVGYTSPPPFLLTSSAGGPASFNQGASDAYTLRVASNQYTSNGTGIDYGNGGISSGTQRVVAPDFSVTGPGGVSAVNVNILSGSSGSTACDGYKIAIIQLNCSASGGSYVFEGSNDNSTFFNIGVYNSLNTASAPITGAISASNQSIIYVVPLNARYIRVRINTALTGGTIQSITRFSEIVPPILVRASVTQADYQTAGNITGTSNVVLAVDGSGTVGAQVSGTWTGTITIEGSLDGSNWYGTPSIALTSGGTAYNFTTNNIFQINCSGLKYVRLRGNTVATGTANVTLVANQSTGVVMLENPIPSGTNTIGNIANISGTVSLPTGASTEATLSAINTKTPALGSANTAFSTPVNIAYDQVVQFGPNGPTTFGSISALNGFTVVNVAGYTACAMDIRGTFTATLSFQGTLDGTNWIALQAIPYGSAQNVNLVTSTPSPGAWLVQCAGCVQVRTIATAYTSGTITTVVRATTATSWTYNAPVGSTNAISVASGTLTTVSTVSSVTAVASVTSDNLASATTTDIASGAITTTTTSANIATTNIQSVAFQVAITAVSGTTPTLDIVLQETMDGVNFYDVYHFERITATGTYYSPVMKLAGIGFRYVRTVTGTTPSFTMSAIRIGRAGNSSLMRRLIDRTMNPNTLGSSSSALFTEGTNQPYLVVSLGAGGTGGSPSFVIQGSEDGSNWYNINGSTVTVATNSIGHANPLQGHLPKFIRASVATAGGSGYTLNYASVKSMGP